MLSDLPLGIELLAGGLKEVLVMATRSGPPDVVVRFVGATELFERWSDVSHDA